MSDNTKKSIVINQSFLSSSGSKSGMGNYESSGTQNKKSKKLRTKLTDESILKPNKLKRMLLDKINAKRKAEQTSPFVKNNNNSNINIDVSKESKIFSSEFKKSLEFLDNYVNTKQFDKNRNNSKTLKKQNAASLSNDIIKTLHNNNTNRLNTNIRPVSPLNSINNIVQTQRFVPQQHQQNNIRSTSPVSFSAHNSTNPSFQKIELQLPPKLPTVFQMSSSPSIINTPSKINLALGKPFNGENLIHTELPPELQPSTPSTMMFIPSSSSISPTLTPELSQPILSTSTVPNVNVQEPMSVGLVNVVDTLSIGETGEMREIEEINNQKLETDSLLGKTSLATSTSTFSPIKLFDDKPYGCLKDGKKPTYRAYNRTIKNNLRFSDSCDNDNNDDDDNDHSTETERQQKLRELQNKHRQKKDKNNNDNTIHDEFDNKQNKSNKVSIRRHFRKTITKKFKLGKQGNTVGVLIKNNETRKNIQKEHGILKNKKLSDVKKYLVEHNLIKIGSTAPPAIIRKIYEDSVLTGEVENIGKGVSLHNFLEEEKPW